MKIRSSESVRVYRTQGGGCSLILAIPFTALGALLLIIGIFAIYRGEGPALWMGTGATVFGLFMLSMTIPMVSTTRGITLDRIQGTASQWRRIFGSYKTLAVHKLNEFRSIEIYNQEKPGRRTTFHIVQLTGDSEKLILCDLALLELARETAKDASAFLSLTVIDKTAE